MGVSVGVNVNVGNAVSDGWGEAASVKVKVGCGEAVSVGEGGGFVVQVGSMVGVGYGWMNFVKAPHPSDVSVINDIVAIILYKFL
jgi:hypothetical protein